VAVLGVVASDEVVQVAALQRVRLQREVFVVAEVVDPQRLCPRGLARGLAVEEKDIGFDTLRIEYAGRQTQECVLLLLINSEKCANLARRVYARIGIAESVRM
jgi:hypothetical protein